jgi:hypothetical protein
VVCIACTVFFEDPFWVGVWERTDERSFCVAKATFGTQPSDAEVWSFVLERYSALAFSKPEFGDIAQKTTGNPKRMQREAARVVSTSGIGTKAQQALKAQYEAGKLANKALSREEKRVQDEQKFLLRQEKKKAKHRGR